MKKNLIIFDFFGVVSCEVAPLFFSKHFSKGEAEIMKNKYCLLGDLGLYDIDELSSLIAKDLGLDGRDIYNEWMSGVKINYEVVSYIKELRKDNIVVLLSNASKFYVERIMEKYGLNNLFEEVFISSSYHMAKPDPKFYELVLNKYKGLYNKAYMTDDNPNNLSFLESIGIKPILFTNLDNLKLELNKYLEEN